MQWLGQALKPVLQPMARRLDVRIVALFLILLLLVQMTSFITIRHGIDDNAHVQIAVELRNGESVLRRLLAQNAQKLTEGARLLAADYGFRDAISSKDAPTILDALDNQGLRIGASAAVFTDPQQRLVATTLPNDTQVLPLVQANLRLNGVTGHDSTVRVLDGIPFQLVTVPVKAPQLVGHVSMGFAVTAELLHDMELLTPLKVVLVSRPLNGSWRVLPLGENSERLAPAAAQLGSNGFVHDVVIAGEAHTARLVLLATNASDEVAAVLLRSVDEAVAPYRQLQLTLIAITLGGLVVFAIGSLITARRITDPIKQLSASAERLGAGDYSTPVTVTSRDEVHELAQSFETMRQGMQQREAQIRRLAYWDALTGLPNREQFRSLVAERIAQARASSTPCAVLMLDLDRFKHVNDVLGHAFGDRVLRQIAARLSEGLVRDGDCVARLSGDEFAVCLPATDAEAACQIARRLQLAMERPLTLDDHTVDVGAGFGVATFPAQGSDADILLGRAEVAMYASKAQQSIVKVYDPGLDSASEQSLSLLSELRHAVDHDELRLFLQPKLALASGKVVGAEALVRWQHPTRGMQVPMSFIPFAEKTGFIRELTGWMIERCAARSTAMREAGFDFKFAVNLSTRDLLDQDLPAKLERLLSREAMDPRSLCMEITESAIMDDPQRALQTLQRLHDMGLRLSIDDFGTGYSSLAYLKRLPLHELKIDKSFVMAMESDRADLKIVRSTIDLAHNLGLSVVAEGVETAQTWALLRAMQCDEAQGYYMARPMPEADFPAWAAVWSPPDATLRSEFASLTN